MDVGHYRKVIKDCFPQIDIDSARPIVEGWDSFVLEVNGELIFRFPRRSQVAVQLAKEIELLPRLGEHLSVPIPRFDFICKDPGAVARFVGYPKIQGVPLNELSPDLALSESMARQLARFLSELHSFPVATALQAGLPDNTPSSWWAEYRDLYARIEAEVLPLLSPRAQYNLCSLWEAVLSRTAVGFGPTLVHRDLGSEHIICDRTHGSLTGIIDWGDAEIGDPAIDFVGLLHSYGREFVERVLASYQGALGATFWERALFYTRIIPIYGALYGPEIDDKDHLKQSIIDLEAEFAEPSAR